MSDTQITGTGNGKRDASAFRPKTEELNLSSGKRVIVKKPDIPGLVMANADSGDVPTPLVDQIARSIATGKAEALRVEFEGKDLPALNKFMNLLIRATLVWPVIVDEDPDYVDTILIDDLPTPDKQRIFGYAMQGAASAAGRFPTGQEADVEPVPDGDAVQPEAE